jgi:hypothetical protein
MLGPPKPRLLDQPVTVSLEELVPAGQFYRHLDATLDLSFVRTWVQDGSAVGGRPRASSWVVTSGSTPR